MVFECTQNLLCLDEAMEVTCLFWTLNVALTPSNVTVIPSAYIEHEPFERWMFMNGHQSSYVTLSNIHSRDSTCDKTTGTLTWPKPTLSSRPSIDDIP